MQDGSVQNAADRAGLAAGDEVEVLVGPVAHGGQCVARHEGQVLFVRHALPGERVLARVTDLGPGGRFVRADAIDIRTPAPGRVSAPCPYAGPPRPDGGGCGGCDWQHADLGLQRELKAQVVTEQFARLAHLDVEELLGAPLRVEPVPGDADGLRWRTRVEFAIDRSADGQVRLGLREHRSHRVVPLDDCLIATEPVASVLTGAVQAALRPADTAVDVAASATGELAVVPVPSGERSAPLLTEHVVAEHGPGGAGWSAELPVSSRGFWQAHPGAASTFVATVLAMLEPLPGERAVDLYCGVGVFAAALADAVGPDGLVLAVEGDRVAAAQAERNLASRGVEVRRGSVERVLRPVLRAEVGADLVVLDPPRSGAGKQVMAQVAALEPRRIAYVACDPAALARDVAWAREQGYRMTALRAFDAFPMTHHIECVALLEPTLAPGGAA